MLGIGVITYNRIDTLRSCIRAVEKYTKVPYRLIIADDDSTDRTLIWARGQRYATITGEHRGCAWNKNRALFALAQNTDCDMFLLLEDDCWPIQEGWEEEWIAAANQWHHVNYIHRYHVTPPTVPGTGSVQDPWQCAAFNGCCTITSRHALETVGYLDTRFVGYGWEHVEWTWRYYEAFKTLWNFASPRVPCLSRGLELKNAGTLFNEEQMEENGRIYGKILGDPIYRPAWHTEKEREVLQREVQAAYAQLDESSASILGNPLRQEETHQIGDTGRVLSLGAPFDFIKCSWPRPVEQVNSCWASEPEWDAPLMPTCPQPHLQRINDELCWTIDWRELFKGGLKPYHPSLGGLMRGFHVVFQLQMNASGKLIFWDDDGCIIRRDGQIIHQDLSAHMLTRNTIDVNRGDKLEVAQWQFDGEWIWGAWLGQSEQATAPTAADLLLPYLDSVQQHLLHPNGPPLKMFTHGNMPVRTVVALYSMILNGYVPSQIMIFGEHQWTEQSRQLLITCLPFANVVSTEQVVRYARDAGGSELVKMLWSRWFVLKTFVTLLYPPAECCCIDDDVFVLDDVADALSAFQQCDLVFTPDIDHSGTYARAWNWIHDERQAMRSGKFNAGLYWIRDTPDAKLIAEHALRSRPIEILAFVWEQGLIAALYADRDVYALPNQRYFYPLFDGLPGGMLGYDYVGNPCGFASVHFAALVEKPSDTIALELAPKILHRARMASNGPLAQDASLIG